MFKQLVLFVVVLTTSRARHSHFYRRDYTYFVEYDAFYKLHWNKQGVSWNTAFTTCYDEGAKLFYPEEEREWEVVKNLTSSLDGEEATNIIVGFHDETGHGEFVTVDGAVTPTPIIQGNHVPAGHRCISMDLIQVAYKTSTCDTHPPTKTLFVCKRVNQNKNPCPTIDLSYEYKEETKKCYKMNNSTQSWEDAWLTCYLEGGMLLTIESDAEAKVIESMVTTKGKKGSKYFSGIRRIFSGSEFYTVKGKKVQDSGFNRWNDNQHENRDDIPEGVAMCGAIYLSDEWNPELYMTSEDCLNPHHFICEMAART